MRRILVLLTLTAFMLVAISPAASAACAKISGYHCQDNPGGYCEMQAGPACSEDGTCGVLVCLGGNGICNVYGLGPCGERAIGPVEP